MQKGWQPAINQTNLMQPSSTHVNTSEARGSPHMFGYHRLLSWRPEQHEQGLFQGPPQSTLLPRLLLPTAASAQQAAGALR